LKSLVILKMTKNRMNRSEGREGFSRHTLLSAGCWGVACGVLKASEVQSLMVSRLGFAGNHEVARMRGNERCDSKLIYNKPIEIMPPLLLALRTRRGITSGVHVLTMCSSGAPLTDGEGNAVVSTVRARVVNASVASPDFDGALHALNRAGFHIVLGQDSNDINNDIEYQYKISKATGMLQFLRVEGQCSSSPKSPPKWIPLISDQEQVLVQGGWSFLDGDNVEPLSSFDIDAANAEGTYRPKWGNEGVHADDYTRKIHLSSLGSSLQSPTKEEIIDAASRLPELSKSVLLEGGTDPPGKKLTSNGYEFSGSIASIEEGVFCTAVGDLPIFTTADLSPTTASSEWLSFSWPLAEDHLRHVDNAADGDERTEVVCALTGLHLGHYFGPGDGYCINASALKFIPLNLKPGREDSAISDGSKMFPVSWRTLEGPLDGSQASRRGTNPSLSILQQVTTSNVDKVAEVAYFGAGCFWHVELALRRLPGVIITEVGYAGGETVNATYEQVCKDQTRHAEVVRVQFDPSVLSHNVLMDCFLALHDPTKTRALGKHGPGGQYRSCIFVSGSKMEQAARECINKCQTQLQKPVATKVFTIQPADPTTAFWKAEERHQRHDEKRKKKEAGVSDERAYACTLSVYDWLDQYGMRSKSTWGSSMTSEVNDEVMAMDDPRDDGFARMMI
jgi:methionine-S-sulfoxide reductase